jgi:topoisomerase-4 subunit A
MLQDLLDNPASMKRAIIKEIEATPSLRRRPPHADRRSAESRGGTEGGGRTGHRHHLEKGWMRARSGIGHDASQFTFKAGDSLYGAFECRTVDHLLAFGSNGRSIRCRRRCRTRAATACRSPR